MKQILFILVAFSSFFSCTDSTTPTEVDPSTPSTETPVVFKLSSTADSLYHLVGEKHDTAMLLMSNIANARAAVRSAMKENSHLKAVEEISLEQLLALNNADKAMMTWMNEFKNIEMDEETYQAWSEDEIMDYLQKEETKIETVHQEMLESIAKAKAMVARYKK
jgi:Mg2+/Co2+ transporter CorB